jgi:lysophospholipid acyltransferase (LPLAT)-like uncharacterized protein
MQAHVAPYRGDSSISDNPYRIASNSLQIVLQVFSSLHTATSREKVSYETDEFMQQLHPEIVGLWIEKEVT